MVTLNLRQRLNELEMRTNRRYQYADFEKATGERISRQAIRYLLNNQVGSVNLKTLGALLDFFEAEGMPLGVQDLLIVHKEPSHD